MESKHSGMKALYIWILVLPQIGGNNFVKDKILVAELDVSFQLSIYHTKVWGFNYLRR